MLASDIRGEVRGNLRSGVSMYATVQLLRERQVIDERTIGQDGRFEFRSIPMGQYLIRVHSPGYKDEEIYVNLTRPTSREVIPINLRPIEKEITDATRTETRSVAAYQVSRDARREYEQGLQDRRRGDCGRAMPHLQKATTISGKFGEAFNELGNCYKQMGDPDRAEQSFSKAIEYTNSVYPSMNLADLYAVQKRFDEAQKVLAQSMLKYPVEGDLHFAMARLHFDQGQLKEAEAAALEAHSKIHRTADVHLLLAKVYLKRENYRALANQLKIYPDENPEGATAAQVRRNLAALENRK